MNPYGLIGGFVGGALAEWAFDVNHDPNQSVMDPYNPNGDQVFTQVGSMLGAPSEYIEGGSTMDSTRGLRLRQQDGHLIPEEFSADEVAGLVEGYFERGSSAWVWAGGGHQKQVDSRVGHAEDDLDHGGVPELLALIRENGGVPPGLLDTISEAKRMELMEALALEFAATNARVDQRLSRMLPPALEDRLHRDAMAGVEYGDPAVEQAVGAPMAHDPVLVAAQDVGVHHPVQLAEPGPAVLTALVPEVQPTIRVEEVSSQLSTAVGDGAQLSSLLDQYAQVGTRAIYDVFLKTRAKVDTSTQTNTYQLASPLMVDLGQGIHLQDVTNGMPLVGGRKVTQHRSRDIQPRQTIETTTRTEETHTFTQWATPETGILVMVQDGQDQLTAANLFGDQVVTGRPGQNGFQQLDQYDHEDRGFLDKQDSIWGRLRVWVGSEGTGEPGDGELLTMEQAGVGRIDLRFREVDDVVAPYRSTYTTVDGLLLEDQIRRLRESETQTDSSTLAKGNPMPDSADDRRLPLEPPGPLEDVQSFGPVKPTLEDVQAAIDHGKTFPIRDFRGAGWKQGPQRRYHVPGATDLNIVGFARGPDLNQLLKKISVDGKKGPERMQAGRISVDSPERLGSLVRIFARLGEVGLLPMQADATRFRNGNPGVSNFNEIASKLPATYEGAQLMGRLAEAYGFAMRDIQFHGVPLHKVTPDTVFSEGQQQASVVGPSIPAEPPDPPSSPIDFSHIGTTNTMVTPPVARNLDELHAAFSVNRSLNDNRRKERAPPNDLDLAVQTLPQTTGMTPLEVVRLYAYAQENGVQYRNTYDGKRWNEVPLRVKNWELVGSMLAPDRASLQAMLRLAKAFGKDASTVGFHGRVLSEWREGML